MPSKNVREACDHCHNKKLRCERVEGSRNCHKCLQNNLVCVYSPRQPSGLRTSQKRRRSQVSDAETSGTAELGGQAQDHQTDAVPSKRTACSSFFDPLTQQVPNQPPHAWNFGDPELIDVEFDTIEPPLWSRPDKEPDGAINHHATETPLRELLSRTERGSTVSAQSIRGPSASNGTGASHVTTTYQPTPYLPSKGNTSRRPMIPDFMLDWTPQQAALQDECQLAASSSIQIISDLNVKLYNHVKWLPYIESNEEKAMTTDDNDLQNHHLQSLLISTNKFQRAPKSIFPLDDTLQYTFSFVQAVNHLISATPDPSSSQGNSIPQQRASPLGREDCLPLRVEHMNLDDESMLLVLSCHLRLINIYDQFFSNPPQYLNPNFPAHILSEAPNAIVSIPFPTLSIGRFPLPATIPHFLRTRLVLETVTDTYTQLQNALSRLRTIISTERQAGDTDIRGLGLISEMTIELVLSRERNVGRKMVGLRKAWEDRGSAEKLQTNTTATGLERAEVISTNE